MSAGRPLRLGPERRWGETKCGYGLNVEAECDRAATTHVLWHEDNHTSNACDEHMAFIRERAGGRAYETHPFGHDCGMPGALWHTPYEDEDEGYCVFPAVDDVSILTDEPEPVLALAQSDGDSR